MAELKKTEEMEKFEEETGKKAIWQGQITEGFKKWKKGKKVYSNKKERVALTIKEEIKKKWQEFVEKNDYHSLSKLIRDSVAYFITLYPKFPAIESYSDFSHDLKENLTFIKGTCHLLIEKLKAEIESNDLSQMIQIEEKCNEMQEKFHDKLETQEEKGGSGIDILVVDDDESTVKVLESFFSYKKTNIKVFKKGGNIIPKIKEHKPKLVLLDIMLPEKDGYKICEEIKKNEDPQLSATPVYYITAIPKYEVEKRVEQTQADGYFLKPFNFDEFEALLEKL